MVHEAIILAGGEGTRLRPVTFEIPKPLIPVKGIAIITWQAKWLHTFGITKITVIIPPKWQQVFQEWRDDIVEKISGLEIVLLVEPEPMGTLGACVHLLSVNGSDPLIVTNGDELKGLDLMQLVATHNRAKEQNPAHAATLGLVEVSNPSDYGVAELDGSRIVRFHEKPANPPSRLISAGLYCVEPRAFLVADQSKRFLMFEKDLFPQLAERGELGGCGLAGPWFDCGTLERWALAIREWPESAL
ncbi:MAG: nucleotidyltransferase family protein [bacterium]|nr:nucleotidyltransferase family protein [bacterium]